MTFWRFCFAWAALILVAWVGLDKPQQGLIEIGGDFEVVGGVPQPGHVVDLPGTFQTTAHGRMSSLSESGKTLFVVAWADCGAARTELDKLPDLLAAATANGHQIRMLLRPGSDANTRWFLDNAPRDMIVVIDSVGYAASGMEATVSPSVISVMPDGTVAESLHPYYHRSVAQAAIDQLASAGP